MSLSARVQSIRALEDLKGALSRFVSEAQEALQAAEQEIRRTEEWLQERLAHWRNEVQRRQEKVRRTEAALARCQASGYHDREGRYHAPDCSTYEHTLRQAQIRLREAETELRNVQRWMKAVGDAVAAYRTQAQRLGRLIADLPKADAFLGRKIAELQAYLAVAAPPGQMGVMPSVPPSQPAAGIAQVQGAQWNTVGQPGEVQKLQDGLAALEGARAGSSIAAVIREQGTTVRFGQTGQNVVAYFDPNRNEIVIHGGGRDASPSVLAAHLGHEGTHVQWNISNSIDQEYHAFKAQAEVWNHLKGDQADEQCDGVSWMISLGETRAKWIISDLYPNLPDYA